MKKFRVFHVVFYHPEIPGNTGNAVRMAAGSGCSLHLIEPLGFSMDDAQLRRAGLDYREYVEVRRHASWPAFIAAQAPSPDRLFVFTTRASRSLADARFHAGDWLVFGSETSGLPESVRDAVAPTQALRLPMLAGQRSLNLSNAVAVAVFEAWRQHGYRGASGS